MDRKTIIVIVVLVAIAVGYNLLYFKMYPPQPPPELTEPPATTQPSAPEAPPQPVGAVAVKPRPAAPVAAPVPSAPETTRILRTLLQDIELSSRGAAIKRVVLHKRDDRIIPEPMEFTSPGAPDLMSITTADGLTPNTLYELVESESDDTRVVFQASTRSGFMVRKTYKLDRNKAYQIVCEMTVTNTNATTATFGAFDLNLGIADKLKGGSIYDAAGVDWHNGSTVRADVTLPWFDPSSFLFLNFRGARAMYRATEQRAGEQIFWAAMKNQYFATIVTPLPAHPATELVAYPVTLSAQPNGEPPHRVIAAAMGFAATPIAGGASRVMEFHVFSGPKEYDRLVALSRDPRFGKSQDEALEFGTYIGLVAVPLLKSLLFIGKLVHNYGVAIIIITIVIKLIFWPVTAASMKSMKRMQKLQPLINQLREKYKDDPQRMNQEMMALYREQKINPLGGCLPMLIQIPVFFGLFSMLRAAIELRGASFLWIADLSQPDTIFTIPGLNLGFNPLPLLMVGTMIWQQRITPTTMDPKQAKLMMVLPVVMLVFFYNASSGLALYWTVQGLLSVGQQYWMNMKKDEPESKPPAPPAKNKKKHKKRRSIFTLKPS
jgi:YidC/Oxa1 family membrane protein insertase